MYRLKLHQIVRLREIFQKWRQFALMSRSLSKELSSSARGAENSHLAAPLARVPPPGHLAVYVGPDRERFVIKTSLLAHPLFKALLKKTEAEVGFRHEGGLAIPCSSSAFRSLVQLMQGKRTSHESILNVESRQSHPDYHDGVDDMGNTNHYELQLLLHELHSFHMRDISSHFVNRCGPDEQLNLLVDAGLQRPIYG